MKIIRVVPRGYCQGVVRAIQIAQNTAKENPGTPITMLGMIVHNRYVVEACRQMGIRCLEDPGKTRLQLLDQIDRGIVILTAHGVSPDVYEKARQKHLTIVDATCPDVQKTHDLVKAHCQAGGSVLYIGRRHHPEAEGVLGIDRRVHLIQDLSDLTSLGPLEDVLITTQTTLSLYDTADLIAACQKKYPAAKVQKAICNATAVRQQAVLKLSGADVLLVVGDVRSNNTNQLKEIGQKAGIPNCWLIESAIDLKPEMVREAKTVAVTSGSSTPNGLTDQVIEILQKYAVSGRLELPAAVNPKIL